MSKPACNVAAYRPDPEMLAANFDPRYVEMLLEQADRLLERCVADFREYSALDRAWRELSHDLEILEQELELDRQRAEAEPEPEAEESVEEPSATKGAEGAAEGAEGHAEAADRQEERQPAAVEREQPPITSMIGLRGESIRRRKELASPGGPLAINEQRDLVLKRLCRDYEEALNRIAVAEEGLRLIYGQDSPSPLSSWSETLGASIANCTIWTRSAVEWLVRYRVKEQSFTRAFSVRALMQRNAWGQLRHARDSFSVRLQIPSELFQGVENCRFRGVSASLIGEAGAVPWSAVIKLPAAAYFARAGRRVEVDQKGLPRILLGRVENRRSVRRSEFCGMETHVNASPTGKPGDEGTWFVELLRPVGSATEVFAQVDDLVVEVKVSGVPQKRES